MEDKHLCPSRQGPNSARYRLIVEHFFAREQCMMTSKTADELSAIAIRRSMSSKCTAGIIIIGDEITKGKVADTNSHYVAQKLYSLGVDVRKISVIPDEVDVIAEEVALFSKKFTHVVTAGGIGPTHDDITYQAIAHGLQERLILLPDLVALIKSHFKITVPDYDPLNPPTFPWDVETTSFDPALKMALVPASSRLHHANGVSVFPMVQVNNVYIMPGIPQYLKRCCRHLEILARNPDYAFLTNEIYVQTDEVRLAPILNAAVKQFGAHVSFGSYPVIGHSYYRTKLTMESTNQARLDAAYQYLSSELPADSIVSYDPMAIERAAEAIQDIIGGKGAHHHELQVPVSNAYQVTTISFIFYFLFFFPLLPFLSGLPSFSFLCLLSLYRVVRGC
ncbi:putative FAD synthase, partial [Daphnia magna]